MISDLDPTLLNLVSEMLKEDVDQDTPEEAQERQRIISSGSSDSEIFNGRQVNASYFLYNGASAVGRASAIRNSDGERGTFRLNDGLPNMYYDFRIKG